MTSTLRGLVLATLLLCASARAELPPPIWDADTPCAPGLERNRGYRCVGWRKGPTLEVARDDFTFVRALGLIWVVDGRDTRGRRVTTVESLAPDATRWRLEGDWLAPASIDRLGPGATRVPIIARGPVGLYAVDLPSLASRPIDPAAAIGLDVSPPPGLTPVVAGRAGTSPLLVARDGARLVFVSHDMNRGWSAPMPLDGFASVRMIARTAESFITFDASIPGAIIVGADDAGRLRLAVVNTLGAIYAQRTFDMPANETVVAHLEHAIAIALIGPAMNRAELALAIWRPTGDDLEVGPAPRFITRAEAAVPMKVGQTLVSDGHATAILVW